MWHLTLHMLMKHLQRTCLKCTPLQSCMWLFVLLNFGKITTSSSQGRISRHIFWLEKWHDQKLFFWITWHDVTCIIYKNPLGLYNVMILYHKWWLHMNAVVSHVERELVSHGESRRLHLAQQSTWHVCFYCAYSAKIVWQHLLNIFTHFKFWNFFNCSKLSKYCSTFVLLF